MIQTINHFILTIWFFSLLEFLGYALIIIVALVLGIGAVIELFKLIREAYETSKNSKQESDFSK